MYLLRCDSFNGVKAWHRQGTTDAATLRGALVLRNYRKGSVKFDVERGERWLDLGAARLPCTAGSVGRWPSATNPMRRISRYWRRMLVSSSCIRLQ